MNGDQQSTWGERRGLRQNLGTITPRKILYIILLQLKRKFCSISKKKRKKCKLLTQSTYFPQLYKFFFLIFFFSSLSQRNVPSVKDKSLSASPGALSFSSQQILFFNYHPFPVSLTSAIRPGHSFFSPPELKIFYQGHFYYKHTLSIQI